MVKVREFGCGCSLRSGTFIVAWCFLIYTCYLFITNMYVFFLLYRVLMQNKEYHPEKDTDEYPPLSFMFMFAYNIIESIIGIAVSIVALWALHKNKVKFLNGLFWYLCYMVVTYILSEILIIIRKDWEILCVQMDAFLVFYDFEIIPFLILYTFVTAIISYYALIVKSYRDYSLRNDGLNVQFVGPDVTTVGYIQAA